jgi:acetoin utilization deacetylase AcuC-like enzyme
VTEESFYWHDGTLDLGPWVEPGVMFESGGGKRRIANLVTASGLADELVRVPAIPVSVPDLLRVHTAEYVERVHRMSVGDGGEAGDYAHVGRGSFEIARLAAGGTYEAVRAILTGRVGNAYALVRPAGHHAEADRGRGYCLFGNLAVAIAKARADLGIERVAVLDWDVHHGNGTQALFWTDPNVLAISLHQHLLYPEDSGYATEVGEGAGVGSTINVPLPPGSGEGAYTDAMIRVVEPAMRRFRPDLLAVSSGFDAGGLDPLGRMLLSAAAFGRLTDRVLAIADEVCEGRVVMTHEGGYSDLHAPFCGLRVLERLSGAETDVEDPFGWLDDDPHQILGPHQEAAIDAAVEAAGE